MNYPSTLNLIYDINFDKNTKYNILFTCNTVAYLSTDFMISDRNKTTCLVIYNLSEGKVISEGSIHIHMCI